MTSFCARCKGDHPVGTPCDPPNPTIPITEGMIQRGMNELANHVADTDSWRFVVTRSILEAALAPEPGEAQGGRRYSLWYCDRESCAEKGGEVLQHRDAPEPACPRCEGPMAEFDRMVSTEFPDAGWPPNAEPGEVCVCCREEAPLRDPDPWDGRLNDYCVNCAECRCDAYPGACRRESAEPGEYARLRCVNGHVYNTTLPCEACPVCGTAKMDYAPDRLAEPGEVQATPSNSKDLEQGVGADREAVVGGHERYESPAPPSQRELDEAWNEAEGQKLRADRYGDALRLIARNTSDPEAKDTACEALGTQKPSVPPPRVAESNRPFQPIATRSPEAEAKQLREAVAHENRRAEQAEAEVEHWQEAAKHNMELFLLSGKRHEAAEAEESRLLTELAQAKEGRDEALEREAGLEAEVERLQAENERLRADSNSFFLEDDETTLGTRDE